MEHKIKILIIGVMIAAITFGVIIVGIILGGFSLFYFTVQEESGGSISEDSGVRISYDIVCTQGATDNLTGMESVKVHGTVCNTGEKMWIGEFLDVEVYRGTISGLKTVGMAATVTNKGVLVHPRASKFELDRLDEIFSLHVDIGTVNLGSPLVGSGLLANSKGYVVGRETTGHEMGRIEDALGYL